MAVRDELAADFEEHRQHLKQLEMESARHTAPDHESAAVPEALQQLRDELNALKTANEVAKAELARQGAEQLEHFRREYASIAAERDSLRCELSAAKAKSRQMLLSEMCLPWKQNWLRKRQTWLPPAQPEMWTSTSKYPRNMPDFLPHWPGQCG